MQLYERLKEATGTTEDDCDQKEKEQIEAALTELAVFIKKIEPFLKQLKADLAGFLSKKQAVMQCYAGTAKILTDYEDLNLAQYTDLDAHKLVINSPESQNLKESMLHTLENLRNPFTDLYHWVKGELYDLSAMKTLLEQRVKIGARTKELKKKLESTQADIDSINAGKKTVTTIFKNANDVGELTSKVEGSERELEVSKKLFDVISVYIGKKILPEFKEEKLRLYCRILQQFHVVEISNSHQLASFWNQVLQNENVKNANVVTN